MLIQILKNMIGFRYIKVVVGFFFVFFFFFWGGVINIYYPMTEI